MIEASARKALDEWYTGATDDPSKVVMYFENVLVELAKLRAVLTEARDWIADDVMPGNDWQARVLNRIDTVLADVQDERIISDAMRQQTQPPDVKL